jgi:hypothetical protein
MLSKSLLSIPEYYKKYKNPNIDLEKETSIPCEFHNEKHGKSFTYSPTKKVFRCWGECHTGGNVINLHMLNYGIRDYDEAKQNLYQLEGITEEITFQRPSLKVDENDVRYRIAYSKAISVAKTIEDWIELDMIMSIVPVDPITLEVFANSRKKV